MIQYEYLQIYWWLLISVLGAILVFLLFVQGGQTLLYHAKGELEKEMMVNSIGRKWELTFTTLVTFGGAFFASFPLFYSTSFGGAYWLWVLILFGFVLQSVSYKFRSKPRNLYKSGTYDAFLFFNGCVGCILLGVAVAMFFFGAEFIVNKQNLLDVHTPVISQWASTHGLEAIFCWKNLLLGFTVLFLARVQALLYYMNNIDDEGTFAHCKKMLLVNGIIFVVFFLAFAAVLLLSDGYQNVINNGVAEPNRFEVVAFKYFKNFLALWWALAALLLGVVAVLYGIIRSAFSKHFTKGIWFTGVGTVLVVLALFWVAGYNNTPYYPSLLDADSSLSIYNSSSSPFTLQVMSIVSLIIPFVVAYIAYAWYALNKKPITAEEVKELKNEE